METLIKLVCLWCVGALASASILKIWFDTTFVCLVFKLLRRLGWKKRSADYWDISQVQWDRWLRFQWERWSANDKIPPWLHHLMNCPGCFSFHVGVWVSIALSFATQHWWFLLIGPATYVWAGLWLFGKVSDYQMIYAQNIKKKSGQ